MAKTATGENFVVRHHMVGPWPRDHVLTAKDFADHSPDVSVERLLALGAIEPTDEEPTGLAPPGPENRQILVDATGRALDAPGFDRPDVLSYQTDRSREAMRRETAKRAGLNPDTLLEEGEPEEAESGGDEVADIRSRPNALFESNSGEEATEDGATDYGKMKIQDLRADAEGRGIPNVAAFNKNRLIQALKQNDRDRTKG